MLEVKHELLLSSLFTPILFLNDIAKCKYKVVWIDPLYGRASLYNDIDGFITCLDSIDSFRVYKDYITLFCGDTVITLTKDGIEIEED